MSFKLSPLKESDIPAFALADEAANKDWPYAQAQQLPGVPRHAMVEDWTRKDWGKDPTLHWLKVANSETDEFVAAALWKIPAGGQAEGQKPESTEIADAGGPAPVGVAGKEPVERPVATINDALFATTKRDFEKFNAEYIGAQPHANLMILMTDPKYQRMGAGSMLVRWGCDKADERNLISSLTASAAGVKVYTNHGFEIKQQTEFDLRPYGIEGTEIKRRMIRLPNTGKHLMGGS